jgi:DNA-binding response OmpR family regulator
MGDFLEARGYRLSQAINGRQAIEVLNKLDRECQSPDLIIL